MKLRISGSFGLVFAFLLLSASTAGEKTPLPVTNFDVNQFAGRWYEIARLPTPWEYGCHCTTADYSARGNSDIRVVDRCIGHWNTKWKATGAVRFKGAPTTALMEVSYTGLPPFTEFRVVELDNRYEMNVMTDQNGFGFWIYSRNPTMSHAEAVSIARRYSNFVSTDSLIFDVQDGCRY